MSSKGRGSVVEPNEFYRTPAWCVDRLLDSIGHRLRAGPWLEFACGDGAIAHAVNAWRERQPRALREIEWFGVDVIDRPFPGRKLTADFTDREQAQATVATRRPRRFRVGITNPPFSKAWDMLPNAMQCCEVSIMLLRVGWLGSNERAAGLREQTPSVYLLPDRPSFRGRGRTDSDYYAWLAWGLDPQPRFQVLGSTPLAERKAEYSEAAE